MSDQLDRERLKEKIRALRSGKCFSETRHELERELAYDVPALLAETERLEGELAEARRDNGELRDYAIRTEKQRDEARKRCETLAAALRQVPCRCKTSPVAACPTCGCQLRAVTRPSDSPLNEDQFDSIRAGDWFCTNCKGNEARTGYKYWWDRDLKSTQCSRCAALASEQESKS